MSESAGARVRFLTRLAVVVSVIWGTSAAYAQPNWTQQSPPASPDYREASWMTWDPGNRNVVMFGGCSASACPSNDTWTWDGKTWTQKLPALSPPARFRHCMLYDTMHQQVVMFAGEGVSGFLNDTWVWDGTNWTQLSPANIPPWRYNATMTYDPVHNQIMMFGGAGNTTVALNDTWIWTGANWVQQSPALSPEGRAVAGAAYDALIQQTVLFSGISSALLPNLPNEVWLWDGAQWKQQSQNPSPAPQFGGAMAYDELRQQVVLFGGDTGTVSTAARSRETWIYANNAVQQFVTLTVTANPPAGGAVTGSGTYRTGQTVSVTETPAAGYEFVGWSGADCSGNHSPCAPLLSGTGGSNQATVANFRLALSWLKLNPGVSAAPNDSLFFSNPASMTYDSVRNQIVYFGGSGGTQTWIWNGTTWALRIPAHSPTARSGAALAFDQARQVVVLFGGWVLAPPTAILTPQSFKVAKDGSGNCLVTTVLPLSLDPGEVSGLFDFFDITIHPSTPPGPYPGSDVSLLGGADSNALDDLIDLTIDVTVAAQSSVPEPPSAELLIPGAGWMVAQWIRRRRRIQADSLIGSAASERP